MSRRKVVITDDLQVLVYPDGIKTTNINIDDKKVYMKCEICGSSIKTTYGVYRSLKNKNFGIICQHCREIIRKERIKDENKRDTK